MSLKSTCLRRSSVIDIEAMITSIWPEVSEGMMPSHATGVMTHCIWPAAQTALIRSTSQPTQLPDASGLAKGG